MFVVFLVVFICLYISIILLVFYFLWSILYIKFAGKAFKTLNFVSEFLNLYISHVLTKHFIL